MARQSPNFQQLFETNYTVEEAIIRNLDRSDLRNLRLAGMRVSASLQLQQRWLIPTQCQEINPWDKTQCRNSTENVNEIRPCEGHPPAYLVNPFVGGPGSIERWSDPRDRRICAGLHSDTPEWRLQVSLHRNICRPCRQRDITHRQSTVPFLSIDHPACIRRLRTPLCPSHSRDQELTQLPHNVCHCTKNISGKWRCSQCCNSYLFYLTKLSEVFRSGLLRSWTSVTEGSDNPEVHIYHVCPVQGCSEQAYDGQMTTGQWQQCLGCRAIFSG